MKKWLYFPILLSTLFGLTACASGMYDSGYSYTTVTRYETPPTTIVVRDRHVPRYYWRHHYAPRPHVIVRGGGSQPHYGPPSGGGSQPHYGPPQTASSPKVVAH